MSLERTITPDESETPEPARPVTARTVWDGFELFVMTNGELQLAVAPALGAKVVSLRNLRSGREWLWHPASGLKLFPSSPGEDFSRGTLVGWDECLPTIAPCTWKGRALPDHGEAWTQPWTLDPSAWANGVLNTAVHLPVSGLRFTRSLRLSSEARNESGPRGVRPSGSTLTVEYVLENPTAGAQEFVWAAHPLLALQEGDRLELTEETRSHLPAEDWLDTLEFPAGSAHCAKVYAGPLKVGRAGVFNPRTGDRLTFEWNTAECDTLGLWLTRGGWNGHHHLALEPAIGAADSVAEAATQSKRCGVMPPHSTKTWRFLMHVES